MGMRSYHRTGMSDDPASASENGAGDDDGPTGRIVIVDTNALMMQFQYYLDLETELQRVMPGPFDVVVPSSVVDELETLSAEGNGKSAEEARLAIELAHTFEVVETEGQGDEAIIDLASSRKEAVVVTNDKLLRARLRAKGIPNVHMRSKAFLSVEGFGGV